MKESELERIFVNEIRREGGEAYKWVSPGNDGVPDRIVMFPCGEIYFIELKADTGRTRGIQKKQIGRIRALGQGAAVVKGEFGVISFFEAIGRPAAAARLRERFFRHPEERG